MVNFINPNFCFLKTVPNRLSRQACPMFNPTKPLLLSRCDDYSVPQKTRCRIRVVRVDAQDEHGLGVFPLRVDGVCAQATAPGHLRRDPQSQPGLPSRCCDESQVRSASSSTTFRLAGSPFFWPAYVVMSQDLGEGVERASNLRRRICGTAVNVKIKYHTGLLCR